MVVVDQKHCFHSDDVISYSYPTTLSTQLESIPGNVQEIDEILC